MAQTSQNAKLAFSQSLEKLVVAAGHKLSVAVLFIGCLATGGVFLALHAHEADRDRARLEALISKAEANIVARMDTYQEALSGGVGLYRASPAVGRSEWAAYVHALNVFNNHPGLKGFGVISSVLPQDLARFTAQQGEDFQVRSVVGQPEFVHGRNEPHFILTFMEPPPPPGVIGLDLSTETRRREAAELARDTGKNVLSRFVIMVEEKRGFLLYVPLYRSNMPLTTEAERRSAHLGWVFAPFYIDLFLDSILANEKNELNVHVLEGEDRTNVLYSTGHDPASHARHPMTMERTLTLAERPLTFVWEPAPGFFSGRQAASVWAAWLGGSITLLLAGLIISLQTVNGRARALASKMTGEANQRERLWKTLMQTVPVGIFQTNAEGRCIFVNQRWTELANLTYEQSLRGGELLDHIHPDDREAVIKSWRELTQGGSFHCEYRFLSPPDEDGERWVSGHAVPLRNERGEVTGYLGTVQDIRSIKAYKDNIEKKNAALEKALAQAETATRVKSEFLANVSHEIRTPLNGMIGMAGLLAQETMTAEGRDMLSTIRECGNNLLALVNDLLDFSKAESGKFEIEHRDFDLGDCIDAVVTLLRPKAKEKGLTLNLNVGNDVPHWLHGDATRLQQILFNLVGNAIKFTRAGRVDVLVEHSRIKADSCALRFSVTDTGIGIPEDRIDRLFQSFTQIDASTAREFGGTGLGLAISRKLCELMGGSISVRSTLGEGSTFSFVIPMRLGRSIAIKRSIDTNMGNNVPIGEPSPLRILVAEDNTINQRVLLKILEKLGYRADVVVNGREVLEALRRQAYDVVLMDIQMPEMSGTEAARAIVNGEAGGNRPYIVALTANAMEGDREACLAAGMQEYLSKPVNVRELARILASIPVAEGPRARAV